MKNYVYIFTRQDMIPEQQAVQTAHATMKLGFMIGEGFVGNENHTPNEEIDPSETHFTLVGVRNLEALEAVSMILEKFNLKYETFIEPDIGDEPTSIAVYPIPEDKRGPLMAFNLLKMSK